ncbi:MAG: sulfite exporter TauE/SafE family protein [Rhodocyclaceae bacterium]|nr:sulfite exporter TauE/SafE family protein [Rhodocyclaceae bacterium]
MEFTFIPSLSFSGFLVGVLVGLTGVGGGSLMTPLLVMLFGYAPATAVGTDLLFAAVTKGGGTLVHHQHDNIDWRIVGWLALGSLPATALTIYILSLLGIDKHDTSHLIIGALGIALILTAGSILFRQRLLAIAKQHVSLQRSAERTALTTVCFGAILGAMVSITSVGAGALGVTILVFLYPHLPMRQIIGSDIAHAVPLTLLAGVGHWWLGTVDFPLLINLLIGSLPGIILGSYFTSRVPERGLRSLLAAVLVLVGGKLIFA